MNITPELEQNVLENSEYVAALERLLDAARHWRDSDFVDADLLLVALTDVELAR